MKTVEAKLKYYLRWQQDLKGSTDKIIIDMVERNIKYYKLILNGK